jgi:hypothetical protein
MIMIKKIRNQIFSKEQPKWFKFLNLFILLPILIWPIIFYSTIFFFDNPKNLGLSYLLFFVINAYPFYLLIIAYLNSLLFQKNKFLSFLLPISIVITILYGVSNYIHLISHKLSETIEREETRNKQGFIGSTDEFKIINNKVYQHDTLIAGADAKTFEIVSWDWQRDKNFYYRFGKKITSIDRQSFKLLDYHYAKDKFHVYYDENIIEGADSKTFNHIDGTQDGKDANNCYRWGEKVNCDVLKTQN